MNLQYIELSRSKRFTLWLKQRVNGMYARDTRLWKFAIVSMWMVSCVAVAIASLGMPTGFGTLFDVVTGIALNTIAMAISSAGMAAILAILGARVPRFTTGSLIYMGILIYFVLYFSEFGWKGAAAFSIGVTLASASLGLIGGVIVNLLPKNRRIALGLLTVIVMTSLYASAGFPRLHPVMSRDDADSADQARTTDIQEGHALASIVSDPADSGEYSYKYLTYSSGEDRHRSEFGEGTDLRSLPIDASSYIESWPWLREKFWGFDKEQLPLNGRVWMPEGEGPFPLVLMVHGNHLMEKFSDGGYGYLGELLASKGIVAISVDENFLNYSVWSGIPDQDMKLRAWVLLKHIQQIQQFSEQEGSPFDGRIDFQQIALLGHSRGGQAAAMAANSRSWFVDDKSLPEAGSYSIKAVVALAPTDTEVDGKWTELKDISYLTLQGAKDADLVNFYGDRQYGRVKFTGRNTEAFKASLYIEDANHSQFNTEWGESDNAMPAGLFIRPKELLEPDQQRRVAQVYVSAFLEAVLQDNEQYHSLFRDYRVGLDFLPATGYFNQYESGRFRTIADFTESDREALSPGITAEATDMTDWKHTDALDRQGKGKGDNGVELEWEDESSYTINLSSSAISDMDEEDILMFSLANMVRDLENEEEFDEPEQVEALEELMESSLSIDVEVEDRSGQLVRLPLSRFMEVKPQVATEFTWLPGMESILSQGKFKDVEEPVFQTYELPFDAFLEENEGFDPTQWSRITFYFNEGPGKVMLDNLGLMAK